MQNSNGLGGPAGRPVFPPEFPEYAGQPESYGLIDSLLDLAIHVLTRVVIVLGGLIYVIPLAAWLLSFILPISEPFLYLAVAVFYFLVTCTDL